MAAPRAKSPAALFPKCPTGIKGIDEITLGGLPRGRPTLVCGGTGTGKTLFAMEFLVRGALQYGEPGLFVSLSMREGFYNGDKKRWGEAKNQAGV